MRRGFLPSREELPLFASSRVCRLPAFHHRRSQTQTLWISYEGICPLEKCIRFDLTIRSCGSGQVGLQVFWDVNLKSDELMCRTTENVLTLIESMNSLCVKASSELIMHIWYFSSRVISQYPWHLSRFVVSQPNYISASEHMCTRMMTLICYLIGISRNWTTREKLQSVLWRIFS